MINSIVEFFNKLFIHPVRRRILLNILNFENEKILRTIPQSKSFVCLYSGGKDSGLALSMACEQAQPVALITCCELKHPLFHQHDKDLIYLQSLALKIPISYVNGHWKESPELEALLKNYKSQGVEFVVFGDICNIKNSNRKIQLCQSVGLTPCMPLWNMPYDCLFSEIKKRNLKCILSSVRSELKDCLGKIFDEEMYENFNNLKINPFGENGEFHTTLIDLDVFEFPIKYNIKSINKCIDKFGEKWEISANYYK